MKPTDEMLQNPSEEAGDAAETQRRLVREAELLHRFGYHPPSTGQAATLSMIRATARNLATLIQDQTPAGREQATAITHLEECVMWASSAITRRGV